MINLNHRHVDPDSRYQILETAVEDPDSSFLFVEVRLGKVVGGFFF